MDSLEWSKKYDVLSISRLVLSSLGIPTEHINLLTDDDMQSMADGLQEELSKAVGGFSESIRFIASLYIAEKRGSSGQNPCADRRTG